MSFPIGGSMKRIHLLVLLAVLALPLAAAAPASGSGSGSIVVGEIYASGGNSGATYANDYVELFNRGGGSVAIDGWTLQYASAASTSRATTALSGTIPAGGRYLVQLASGGANGAALPTADATGTSNLAATGGKIAIVDNATALSCGATAGSCSAGSIEDLVGYGGAADYEGSTAAPAPGATTSIARAGGGCTDTDDNAADFATGAPGPQNSTAAANACSVTPPTGPTASAGVDVDVQPVLSIALDHATLSFPGAVPGTTPSPLPEHVTVTSNDSSGYTLSVHRTAFSPQDLPLGIAVGSASLAAVPIAPASDLTLGTSSSASAQAGDVWNTSVGFVSPLPAVPAGHYTSTLTFTVIGR
jgi:hypothetical protein